ncbi:hypothetical protein MAR_020688 [Mya arenaria]|uniref:Uncharacterized protein n=1 Tax=Mya arenaria TaxID=6604 RepID=A0ABY7E829_MYAAR|nr:hypothetical protein MAR_020688 [Mya arenaria]
MRSEKHFRVSQRERVVPDCPVRMCLVCTGHTLRNRLDGISLPAKEGQHRKIIYATDWALCSVKVMQAKGTYDGFMKSICKAAQFDQQYTAHFLRVTAIQTMNEAGFEARHIMFISGH